MKYTLCVILLSGILSSCSIYNYKTVDIPKETYKSADINLNENNIISKETKYYIYDTTNRMFLADYRNLKDSQLHLINFRKLAFVNGSRQNTRHIKLSQDETHLFLNRELNPHNINQTIIIQTSEIDSIYKFQRQQVPKNEFVLRKRAKSALFDTNGFSKNTDKWKFYIQDIDDSTFECRNVIIYDSTLSARLAPKTIERKISLNEQNQIRKNEVYVKINLRCTNKNSQIYLSPKNILGVESYMSQKDLNLQKGDATGKIIGTVLITVLSLITAAVLTVIIAAAVIFS